MKRNRKQHQVTSSNQFLGAGADVATCGNVKAPPFPHATDRGARSSAGASDVAKLLSIAELPSCQGWDSLRSAAALRTNKFELKGHGTEALLRSYLCTMQMFSCRFTRPKHF